MRNKSVKEAAEIEARAQAHAEVRRVAAAFSRSIPPAAASSGYHELSGDELAAAPKLAVPNGRYRVLGHDWIHIFRGGKHVASEKARGSDTDPKGLIEIA